QTHERPAMFRPSRTTTRSGNILLVTILLLALFAIVGITMVYYATATAEKARILTEAATTGGSDFADDGKEGLNYFIGQLIYGVADNGAGLAMSLRGHDLMATMYGRYTITPSGAPIQGGGTVAWNGIGNFNEAAYST